MAILFGVEACDIKKIKRAEQGIQQKVTIERLAAKSKVPWDDDRPGALLNV